MPLVSVFNRGTLYSFERSDRLDSSYFGGPEELVIQGIPSRSRRLHHIVTLRNSDFGLNTVKFGFKVPFLYGIGYEGCVLQYRRTAISAIEITSLSPRRSTADYPYPGHPDLLPYAPLKVVESRLCDASEFFDGLYNTGWEFHENRAYVVVPSPANLGVSLWGPWGDGTEIVFEYDGESGVVRACNQCS